MAGICAMPSLVHFVPFCVCDCGHVTCLWGLFMPGKAPGSPYCSTQRKVTDGVWGCQNPRAPPGTTGHARAPPGMPGACPGELGKPGKPGTTGHDEVTYRKIIKFSLVLMGNSKIPGHARANRAPHALPRGRSGTAGTDPLANDQCNGCPHKAVACVCV